MISMIRIAVISTLTIFILCLNVNGKPIFYPIYSALSLITVPLQSATESILGSAFESGQDYTKRIFNNSVPKVRDAVKSRASAPARLSVNKKTSGEPKEEILPDEREELDDLIKAHH